LELYRFIEQMCYNKIQNPSSNPQILVRKATTKDLPQIKKLADAETKTLGFTQRGAILDGIQAGYVFVAVRENQIIGFQQYYHRKKDLQTTLYRKSVAKEWRYKGVGTMLVNAVVDEAKKLGREKLLLRCPVDNSSNEFHKKFGFVLVRTEPGNKRKLNVYEYRL
jgi:N-acetylglutamate synthase-like GNAT family acetyltransferase